MSPSPYLGVILAAGHGSRMGPFGEEVPKPIVPICNKPLLVYQIEQLRALGIHEIIIVIGHLGHLITATLGNGAAHGVRIRYVEQTQRLGLAHAVGQLEPHIDRPFVLMLGDIFFEVADLGRMVREFEEHHPAAVLATKHEPDPAAVRRNFSVHLRDDGTVRRVIEKPRFVETDLKGCGLYLFDLRIFDAIRRTPRTATLPSSALALTILTKDLRRSSVRVGKDRRMTTPSFEGVSPRSALEMAFSMAFMAPLSKGDTPKSRGSGTEKFASCFRGVSAP